MVGFPHTRGISPGILKVKNLIHMSCNEGTECTNLPGSKNEDTQKSILNSDNNSETTGNENQLM